MSEYTFQQNSFTAGKLSPYFYGRNDSAIFANGLSECLNFTPFSGGGVTRRVGTEYLGEIYLNDPDAKIFPFVYGLEAAFFLVFTSGRIYFYTLDGQVVDGSNSAYYIAHPYTDAELETLSMAQSYDVIYIACPTKAPYQLTRLGNINWTLEAIDFIETPYLPINSTDTTVQIASQTGSGVILNSSTNVFASTDIGRYVRILAGVSDAVRDTYTGTNIAKKFDITITSRLASEIEVISVDAIGNRTLLTSPADYSVIDGQVVFVTAPLTSETIIIQPKDASNGQWGICKITGYLGPTEVLVDILKPINGTNSTIYWSLGAWSDTTGWPAHVTFFEQRVWYGKTTEEPQTIWGSVLGEYINFRPDTVFRNGDIDSASSINLSIASNRSAVINWMTTGRNLTIGTSAGVYVAVRNSNNFVTALNLPSLERVDMGVVNIAPIELPNAIVSVQNSKKKLGALIQKQGIASVDLNIYNPNISESSLFKKLTSQYAPNNLIWGLLENGDLVALTLELDSGSVGWSKHTISGTILDFTTILDSDGFDTLGLLVQRTINGNSKIYLEILRYANPDVDIMDRSFADCSLFYEGTQTNNTITLSSETAGIRTITATNDVFQFYHVGAHIRYGDNYAIITEVVSSKVVTTSIEYDWPSTSFANWELQIKQIRGLDHLEGKSVVIFSDGFVQPEQTVTGGIINIDNVATKIWAGLQMISTIETLPITVNTTAGASTGRISRIYQVAPRLYRSLGVKFGSDSSFLTVRQFNDTMSEGPGLYSAIRFIDVATEYELDGTIQITSEEPVPVTISNLLLKLGI